MSFAAMHWLWMLGMVPVLVVLYALDGQRRRRELERIGYAPMLLRMIASASPARRRLRAVMMVSVVALVLVALARPQASGRARLVGRRGLDLVVALDFSRSMLAKDVYPSRLERAKAELGRLIDTLDGDRVGLVAFAGETISYPLTTDYAAAKLFWRDLQPQDIPVGGTDLGRAINAGVELLKRGHGPAAPGRTPAQIILLLTDGEDTEGQGLAAAKAAAKAGVRIYTAGIGSPERPYVQLFDADNHPSGFIVDNDGKPVRVGLDEGALRQMATITGGDYIPTDPGRFGVERVRQAIAGLQRTEEEARLIRQRDDVGRWFLVPAFVLLLGEACLRQRRRARPRPSEAATAGGAGPSGGAAALIFLLLLPGLGGFDAFLRRDPHVEAGNKLLEAGKAQEALDEYNRAAEAWPDHPVVRFDRGAALYQLGKFAEAQREFQRAADGHDTQLKADAYYNMGNAQMKQEHFKEAFDAYRHALTLRPGDPRAKVNLELAGRKLREQQQKQKQQQAQNEHNPSPSPQPQPSQQPQPQQQAGQPSPEPSRAPQPSQAQAPQPSPTPSASSAAAHASPTPSSSPEGDKRVAKHEPPKEIDKQDAEAVLDALERVEPTVQKDLARARAADRRPTKDW